MARVNQGTYYEYQKKKESLLEGIKELQNEIWDPGNTACIRQDVDIVCIYSFFESAEQLYREAQELIAKYQNLLETQKFEDKKTAEKYTEYIQEIESGAFELQQQYKSLFYDVREGMSDSEYRSFSSSRIYIE